MTCGGVLCLLRCTTCLKAHPDVLCFRMLPKQLSRLFYLKPGVYWRYTLEPAERLRFCGSSKAVTGDVLEVLEMVVSVCVLVSPCAEPLLATGDCVWKREDNEAAVEWVRRCREGKEPRSAALMSFLGALELSSDNISMRNTYRELLTSLLLISHPGIATLFSVTWTPLVLMFRTRFRTSTMPHCISEIWCRSRAYAQRS